MPALGRGPRARARPRSLRGLRGASQTKPKQRRKAFAAPRSRRLDSCWPNAPAVTARLPIEFPAAGPAVWPPRARGMASNLPPLERDPEAYAFAIVRQYLYERGEHECASRRAQKNGERVEDEGARVTGQRTKARGVGSKPEAGGGGGGNEGGIEWSRRGDAGTLRAFRNGAPIDLFDARRSFRRVFSFGVFPRRPASAELACFGAEHRGREKVACTRFSLLPFPPPFFFFFFFRRRRCSSLCFRSFSPTPFFFSLFSSFRFPLVRSRQPWLRSNLRHAHRRSIPRRSLALPS